MSKIVVIQNADVINNKYYDAGEVVTVPDGYSNVRRVINGLSAVSTKNVAQKNNHWQSYIIGRLAAAGTPQEAIDLVIGNFTDEPANIKKTIELRLLDKVPQEQFSAFIFALQAHPEMILQLLTNPELIDSFVDQLRMA